jgi:mono/diheme cytochrome c family protein
VAQQTPDVLGRQVMDSRQAPKLPAKCAKSSNGEHMRRISLSVAPAIIFICLATLAFPSHLRAQSDAAKVYKTNCVLCHSADGSGDSASGKSLKAKDLRSPEVQGKSDEELADVITKGIRKMPAFGKKLSPDVVKSLVGYIRELPKKK